MKINGKLLLDGKTVALILSGREGEAKRISKTMQVFPDWMNDDARARELLREAYASLDDERLKGRIEEFLSQHPKFPHPNVDMGPFVGLEGNEEA